MLFVRTPTILLSALLLRSALPGDSHTLVDADNQRDLQLLLEAAGDPQRDVWWPAVEELGALSSRSCALQREIWERARVNSLGMKFVRIPAGTFIMGPDQHRVFDYHPAHLVAITRPFFLGATEVTNAQYTRLIGNHDGDPQLSPDSDSPVTGVSWEEASRFCRLLSELEGAAYRLPTEAEWEYACRAGSLARYSFGDDHCALDEYAWWNSTDGRAMPVGALKPNGWGVYDMHGNALEWVSDWYSRAYYAECMWNGLVQDPSGPKNGRVHVLRGGAWHVSNPLALTCAARLPLPVLDRVPLEGNGVGLRATVGFRVVREEGGRPDE